MGKELRTGIVSATVDFSQQKVVEKAEDGRQRAEGSVQKEILTPPEREPLNFRSVGA